MNAPTAGPWLVDPKRSLRVMNKDGVTVCSVGADDTQRDSWEANARLIATAPDMYKVLKAMIAALDADEDQLTMEQFVSRTAAALAALLKAEGEP